MQSGKIPSLSVKGDSPSTDPSVLSNAPLLVYNTVTGTVDTLVDNFLPKVVKIFLGEISVDHPRSIVLSVTNPHPFILPMTVSSSSHSMSLCHDSSTKIQPFWGELYQTPPSSISDVHSPVGSCIVYNVDSVTGIGKSLLAQY